VSLLRSVLAIIAGIATVVAPAVLTDMAMSAAGVFPPFEGPGAFTTANFILATAYRCAYVVLGAFVAARLAPSRPWTHVWIIGGFGVAGSLAGALFGPDPGAAAWYPWTLVATALPCAGLGGWLDQVMRRRRAPGAA